MSDETIGIVGAGAFATALASVICTRPDTSAILLCRNADQLHDINRNKRNQARLPGISLSRRIAATSDLEEIAAVTNTIVLAVSSLAIPEVLGDMAHSLTSDHTVVHAVGALIENDRRVSQLIAERTKVERIAAIAGPALPADLVARRSSAVVVAATDAAVAAHVKRALHVPPVLRVYRSEDLLGVELASALACALTVAMGLADGLSVGHGPRTVFLTRAAAEASRLCVENGAQARTFYGMAGLGNFLVRSSPESRSDSIDYQLGVAIARGDELPRGASEGVRTLATACRLAKLLGIDIPVLHTVHEVVSGQTSIELAADRLAAVETDLE